MKKFYLILVLCCFMFNSWSQTQDYKEMMYNRTYSVQQIQEVAEAHFAIVGTGKGTGYKQYKRWEHQALRTMDENGYLKSPDFYVNELERYNNYLNQNGMLASRSSADTGNWIPLGPTYWDSSASAGWNPGVGRLTSIALDKNYTTPFDHIIVGSETGGVWKTLDGGSTWTALTDNFSNMKVFSLAIHPTNSSTYFWGSENGTIFKSEDAGATWNILATNVGNGVINRILIDPTTPTKMYCSNQFFGGGMYKSTDSGATWSIIHPDAAGSNGYDFEFKPNDPNTVYASGHEVFKSTDGGATFTKINPSNYSTGPKMMAVSIDDPTVVYMVEAANSHFNALYKSTDSGTTFTEIDHTGHNYFGYSTSSTTAGDATSGQAPRDMDIAVSPTDINEVFIAGVNIWRSLDGGANFDIASHWNVNTAINNGIGYSHADVDLLLYAGTDLFTGTDGGIFKATNTTAAMSYTFFTDLSTGLGIRQFYAFGISQTNPVIVTGGSQDNGASTLNSAGNWSDWLGGDGMEGWVDKDNTSILFEALPNGSLYRSLDGGATAAFRGTPGGVSGRCVTPFEQDPVTSNVIYGGTDKVYKSTNGGNAWTAISQAFPTKLQHLKVAPTLPTTMYASELSNLYKTTTGTGTWDAVTTYPGGRINSIAIHPTNPNKVALAAVGSEKVYVTTDGGTTWTSYKYNLPNFVPLALAWDNNGNDGLYLGMNYGIYYIDNTTGNSWKTFNNGLPNVQISELEVNYADNQLYVATYGRGLWSSNRFDITTLSTEDSEFEPSTISLYPNPATNEFNLSWNKSDDVAIRVFNALGKLMHYSKDVNISTPFSIDISNYSSGMYFVRINSAYGVVTKKLMVE